MLGEVWSAREKPDEFEIGLEGLRDKLEAEQTGRARSVRVARLERHLGLYYESQELVAPKAEVVIAAAC